LLVENGVADAFRPLVVVSCPEDVQLARIRARNGGSVEDAVLRVRAQKPLAEKVALADFVIDTTGSLEDNARRTDEVFRAVCERVGVDFTRYRLRP
jgi:dephospho-CoA kinase